MRVHLINKKDGIPYCGDLDKLGKVTYPVPGGYPHIVDGEETTTKRRKATCKRCLKVHGRLIHERQIWTS
jgi:hypothetical protein